MTMQRSIDLFSLPRGGTLAVCDGKPIQFGIPPETIKDTMGRPCGVPEIFVLSEPLFNLERGSSNAELEFPIYYNYFLKRRRTTIVCTAKQRRRIIAVLQESLFGPKDLQLALDFAGGKTHWAFPDMRAEMNFFRRSPKKPGELLQMGDFVRFRLISPDSVVQIGKIRLRVDQRSRFLVSCGKETLLIEPNLILRPPSAEETNQGPLDFSPPAFGVTTLGSGHGFDPSAKTSGFILWINRKGIMVDPPVDATDWLRCHQVNPKLINAIILTHCHADHDSGTLQKILEEGRIELYTSRTVMDSFLRKASSLTGLRSSQLLKLVDPKAVFVGTPVRINGGEFRFRYQLHSIPTVGFEAYFQGKSFVYSADTLNDPEAIRKLYRERILPPGRRDDLLDFPWHHTVIFHEAGIPPLHTPVQVLTDLPEDVKKRLYLVHVAGASIPSTANLKVARGGLQNTIRIRTATSPHTRAIEMLNTLCNIEIFRDFPMERASEFLAISKVETFKRGEVIIRKGEEGMMFYILLSGQAAVLTDEGEELTYGPGDYFGETALVLEIPRTTDVVAKTELKAVAMNKYDFLYFIRGTNVLSTLRRLYINRRLNSWQLMDANAVLRELTPTQRTQLQALMDTDFVTAGQCIVKEGKKIDRWYLVAEGEGEVLRGKKQLARIGPGDVVVDIATLMGSRTATYSVRSLEDLHVFIVDGEDMARFLQRNPGVHLRLANAPHPGISRKKQGRAEKN